MNSVEKKAYTVYLRRETHDRICHLVGNFSSWIERQADLEIRRGMSELERLTRDLEATCQHEAKLRDAINAIRNASVTRELRVLDGDPAST